MASNNEIINEKKFVSRDTQRRLIRDISSLYKNPLNDQGIYYIHDDEDILKGYAMIYGPNGTPYENGVYLFEFYFPSDYPVNPPKVIFLNRDGKTRFNPNLYRNGKVCLSILNTWRGEGWTSCQTIRSVLLTLVTVLNENPLLNEPGVTERHSDFRPYNKIIEYKNIEYSILELVTGDNFPSMCVPFLNFAKENIHTNKKKILEKVEKLAIKNPEPIYLSSRVYDMSFKVDYNKLFNRIIVMFAKLDEEFSQ